MCIWKIRTLEGLKEPFCWSVMDPNGKCKEKKTCVGFEVPALKDYGKVANGHYCGDSHWREPGLLLLSLWYYRLPQGDTSLLWERRSYSPGIIFIDSWILYAPEEKFTVKVEKYFWALILALTVCTLQEEKQNKKNKEGSRWKESNKVFASM